MDTSVTPIGAPCPSCERAIVQRLVSLGDAAYWQHFESLLLEGDDTIPKGAKLVFVVAEAGCEEPTLLAGRCPLCSDTITRQVEGYMADAEARIAERFTVDDAYMRRFSELVAAEARKRGREVPEGAVLALLQPSWATPLPETRPAHLALFDVPLPPIPDRIDEAEARRSALALSMDDIARAVLVGFSAVMTKVPAGKEIPALHQLEVFLRGLADHPGLRGAMLLAAERLEERRAHQEQHATEPRPTAPGGSA